MTTIKIYDWPREMRFRRADIGYSHSSVAGNAYFSGRPQGETLALPRRMTIDASGPLKYKGVAEVVRFALAPNNLVRMPDPMWSNDRAPAVSSLAVGVVWESGAAWATGATWSSGQPLALAAGYAEGARTIGIGNLPPLEQIFRHGDILGIDGVHYMAAAPVSSNEDGDVTVRLVRGLQTPVSADAIVEYPVRHLFSAIIPVPIDRDLAVIYDWSGTMVEVFKSEFDGVTFETATFFG